MRVTLKEKNVVCTDRYRALSGLESYLRRDGVCLAFARTGDEMIEIVQRKHPDAVILDYSLPDLKGDEFCRHLKGSGRRSHTPHILIVGPTRPRAVAERCLRAGCDDYLGASAGPGLLLQRLAGLLRLQPRRYPRVATVIAVSSGDLVREFLGYARDLGRGGLLLESSRAMKVGRSLHLRLFLEPQEEPLIAVGTVLRSVSTAEADQFLLGIQFSSMGRAPAARLKEYLSERLER
jgi:CheY-like chemotaxis protein